MTGNISYKLDTNNFIVGCSNCSNFTNSLSNVSEGIHFLSVKGETENKTKEAGLFFLVNLTLSRVSNRTNESVNNFTRNNETRFSLGFQKLPKQFGNGEISASELTNIIRNNKLNPGVINRLVKTGKLTQENVDAIVETQFLSPGILNKLLGKIGFARNNNLEDFIENINLTDSQLSTLIERNQISEKTIRKLIKRELGEKSLDSLIKKSDEKILYNLIKRQTLSGDNIRNILEKNPSHEIINLLIQNQILDEENINTIIDLIENKKELIENQKLSSKQKKILNIKEEKTELKNQPIIIGKQQKKSGQDLKADENKKGDRSNLENNQGNSRGKSSIIKGKK